MVAAPDLAAAIRRQLAGALRTRKGGLPARYLAEFCTFALPAGQYCGTVARIYLQHFTRNSV